MSFPIPLIETYGEPYEVGHQIGAAARGSLRALHAATRAEYGDGWTRLLKLAAPFLAHTEKRLPQVIEEMRGCAEGAEISFDDLFLMSVEELLYEEVRGASHLREKNKGCTDLAAAPPATLDGHVWLAHNNDLHVSTREHLFVTRFCVQGEPEILAVTVGGLFISIGLNCTGIALTGNQLTANDSRSGVPRLLIVRDLLAQTTLDAALASALMPERASSYNNIIASADGRIVNVEGSATQAALTWSIENSGTIAHTNHYLAPDMLRFEADAEHVPGSASRCVRAFHYAQKYRGRIGFEVCQRFVRDHVYAPWSVCKHVGQSVTVFSALIDVTALQLWLTRGNPCQSEFALYQFEHAPKITEPESPMLQSLAL
ncbi:MAG TPA: C45 family peptidase, partial [Anaerolineae bacterium]|nr:C45 family peptidase [Anaerolineae bacterium]